MTNQVRIRCITRGNGRINPVVPLPEKLVVDPGETLDLSVAILSVDGAVLLDGTFELWPESCGDTLAATYEVTVGRSDGEILPVEPVCVGEEVHLVVANAQSVLWESDLPCLNCLEQTIVPTVSRWYRAKIEGENGCVQIDSVFVDLIQPGALSLVLPDTMSASIGGQVEIGVDVTNIAQASSTVSELDLVVRYDRSLITVSSDDHDLFDNTVLEGWTILEKDVQPGLLRVKLSSATSLVSNGRIINLRGVAYLGAVRNGEVSCTILPLNTCSSISSRKTVLQIDSVCGLDHRLLEVGVVPVRLADVVPNPVTGSVLSLELETAIDVELSVDLIDLSGRVVATIIDREIVSGSRTIQVPMAPLGDGLYFLRVSSGAWSLTRSFSVHR